MATWSQYGDNNPSGRRLGANQRVRNQTPIRRAVPFPSFETWNINNANISVDTDSDRAISDSLAHSDIIMKRTILDEMKTVKEDSKLLYSLKVQFSNTKRNGFDYESVRFGNDSVEHVISKDFSNELKDKLCEICLMFPFDAKLCGSCGRYLCYNCWIQTPNGCSSQPIINTNGQCNGYKDHINKPIEQSQQNLLSESIMIRCEYGELINGKPKWMPWSDGISHYKDGLCPNAKCNYCGLLRYSKVYEHKSDMDCVNELNEFICFLTAKQRLEVSEKEHELLVIKEKLKIAEEESQTWKNISEDYNKKLLKVMKTLEALQEKEKKLAEVKQNKTCINQGNQFVKTNSNKHFNSNTGYNQHFELSRSKPYLYTPSNSLGMYGQRRTARHFVK
jgi:hypothetical protein